MGCVHSANQSSFLRRVGESRSLLHSRKLFKVINVDESGKEVSLGQMEVTTSDLILHQKSREDIVWPLRCIRRYGFDAHLFTFECGRRCATGSGVYGFKCTQAEELFNVLQSAVRKCTTAVQNWPEPAPLPILQSGNIRPIMLSQSQMNSFQMAQMQQFNPSFKQEDEQQNQSQTPIHSYANDVHGFAKSLVQQTDMAAASSGNYTGTDEIQMYVNLQGGFDLAKANTKLPVIVSEPSEPEENQINYTQLDLDIGNSDQPIFVTPVPVTPMAKNFRVGESAKGPGESSQPLSYATIDFDRTSALSQSAATHRKDLELVH